MLSKKKSVQQLVTNLALTTIATFFSSITATTLQFSYQQTAGGLSIAVNVFWFLSLVFSVSSGINSLLSMLWRKSTVYALMITSDISILTIISRLSYSKIKTPKYINFWLTKAPMVFLAVSAFAFVVGLNLFPYSSHQHILVSITTNIFRPLVETIKESLQSDKAHTLHYSPYTEYWTPSEDSIPQRVYGELYTSDAWLEAHEEIQSRTAEDDKIENVVLPLMLWSDSTHLTNFGSASLWPLYMFFGGHSKYVRGKPTSGTGHHIAYIPTLPKDIQDFYVTVFGMLASASVLTHLKRELMHAILLIVLLNPAFIQAYKEGILTNCIDNILRRFYPRFITYSADYPEKALIALIKFLAKHPCPTCFVLKEDIHEMGTVKDERRRAKLRIDDAIRQEGEDEDEGENALKSKQKVLNINTYKFHSIAKVAGSIRRYGTTDSYNTQIGELMHKSLKQFYDRTNKREATQQICNLEERQRTLNTAKQSTDPRTSAEIYSSSLNYQISSSKKTPIVIYQWIRSHKHDPSFLHFLPKLREHILGRLQCGTDAGKVLFLNDRIYQHNVLKVYFTTYDLQRGYHSINPRTRKDVMILSNSGTHPYEYARVLGIFHVQTAYMDKPTGQPDFSLLHFLWIHRYEDISGNERPFETKRLSTLKLCDSANPQAFDFIDPAQIIRGVHLIPDFSSVGQTTLQKDWQTFKIGMFVDRDMFMRIRGGGIGHKTTRQFDEELLSDGTNQNEQLNEEDIIEDNEDEDLILRPSADPDNSDEDSDDEANSDCESDEESDEESAKETDLSSDDEAAEESDDDCQLGFAEL